jgi:hypothetical protein
VQRKNELLRLSPVPLRDDQDYFIYLSRREDAGQCVFQYGFTAKRIKQLISFITKPPTGAGGYDNNGYVQKIHLFLIQIL